MPNPRSLVGSGAANMEAQSLTPCRGLFLLFDRTCHWIFTGASVTQLLILVVVINTFASRFHALAELFTVPLNIGVISGSADDKTYGK